MGTRQKTNRVKQLAANQTFINGLTKHADKLSALTVGGAPVKVADVVAALKAEIAAENAVAPAKATWEATVQAAKDQRAKTKTALTGVKQSLQLMFAGQVETLGDFGLKPRKQPAPRTPQQKAASVAKAMGSVQKKAVQGDVAGVTVTPITVTHVSPPATTSTATSAPAGSSVTAAKPAS
jgi:hypothetical protein